MPFIIQNLIPETQKLVTIAENGSGKEALSLMIENDFSQLPVIDKSNTLKGMVTSDSILKAVSYLKVIPDRLKISHAINKAKSCRIDDDLSAILTGLRDINAIPIVDKQNKLKAIITSYDTAEYFRSRAEDIMLAEDIETTLKDIIESSHRDDTGQVDEQALNHTIQAITPSTGKTLKKKFKSALLSYIQQTSNSKIAPNNDVLDDVFTKHLYKPIAPKSFDKLTLYNFIQIFGEIWPQHSADFGELSWEAVNQLLSDVRQTRNAIAHFREVTLQEREQLKFCADFLDRHRPIIEITESVFEASRSDNGTVEINPTEEEIDINDGRYAPLAVWLQSQDNERVACTFEAIESIIEDKLPSSARRHRNWWDNDSVSHSQSVQWLDAGWRVSRINMSAERVIFSRLGDRQSKYISFFNQLLPKLQTIDELTIKPQTNPQGRHWFWISAQPKNNLSEGPYWISCSFARKSRFRIETYINEQDQKHNKLIFDRLYAQKTEIEADFGAELSWERLDSKVASRIAFYRADSSITSNDETLAEVQAWAVEILPNFYNALSRRFIAAKYQEKTTKNAEGETA